MTPTDIELPTFIGDLDMSSFASSAAELLLCKAAEPDSGLNVPVQPTRDGIRHAVAELLSKTLLLQDCRWERRIAFVRPARVSFHRPGTEVRVETPGSRLSASHASYEVATIELSLDGAGILAYGCHEPLPHRVTLVIEEFAFDCEVVWRASLNSLLCRYGLQFRDVLSNHLQRGSSVASGDVNS